MADGYAQATGRLAVANLHAAPGLGNAMGMLYNAAKAGAPILVTAGQQDTGIALTEPLLWADLATLARPLVKWSTEVGRVADLPRTVHRAAKVALTAPTGPVFVSIPGDVLTADATGVDPMAPTRIGGADARRCREHRRRRRPDRRRDVAADLRRRRRAAVGRACRTRRAGRGDRRAGLPRGHGEHRRLPVGPPPVCRVGRADDPGGARADRRPRPRHQHRRRPADAEPGRRRRGARPGQAADPPRRRRVGDRQELPRRRGDRRRPPGDAARTDRRRPRPDGPGGRPRAPRSRPTSPPSAPPSSPAPRPRPTRAAAPARGARGDRRRACRPTRSSSRRRCRPA